MLSNHQRLSFACLILVSSTPAFAYLDPGTGTAVIQGTIAAIAAIGVTLKLYWYRILKFFSRKNVTDSKVEDEPDQ